MTRSRVSALLTTLVATVAMALGTAAASSPAMAKPRHNNSHGHHGSHGHHYPPPPPRVTVNRGVIRAGDSVRVNGYQFTGGERVTITVRFKANGSGRWRVIKRTYVRTNRGGNFGTNLRLTRAGTAVIQVVGRSGSQSVTVQVVDRRHRGRGWNGRNVAFTSGSATTGTAVTVAQPVHATASTNGSTDNTAALAAAGLAAVGLLGSFLLTRRIVRRRRTIAG